MIYFACERAMTETEVLNKLFSAMRGAGPKPEELVAYARERHGYGLDEHYGVTCASDVDDYERETEGVDIPDGFIRIDYWDNGPETLQIPEARYVEALQEHLTSTGAMSLVAQLKDIHL